MKFTNMFFLFFLIGCSGINNKKFDFPESFYTEHNFHPGQFLEKYSVYNISEELSINEKLELCELIFYAHDSCIKKYNQDCSIGINSEIYLLAKSNFSEAEAVENKRMGIVFLEDIYGVMDKEIGCDLNR